MRMWGFGVGQVGSQRSRIPDIKLVSRTRTQRQAIAPDADQQRAIDHAATPGAGPLLILAGPGTGKTATLVEAVTARVEAGTPAERILVLTFSRKAAQELRDRIATRLGAEHLGATAWTFHAFCFALIGHSDQELSWGAPQRQLISNPEQDTKVRELLQGHREEALPSVKWPDEWLAALPTQGFASELRAIFSHARSLGIEPDRLRAIAAAEGKPLWASVADSLQEYLEVLDLENAIDYTEMVVRAVHYAESAEGLKKLRSDYDVVFVDEYQDTDPAQERLLQAIAGSGSDLIVVGDPDQSIYAFRGAQVKGILEFPDRFRTISGAPAKVIALSTCQRSGQHLVDVANAVAASFSATGAAFSEGGLQHRQRVSVDRISSPGEFSMKTFASTAKQYEEIADEIRRAHIDQGIPWSEIAVLVRSGTRSIPGIHRALIDAGVPVEVAGDEVPLRFEPSVEPMLSALRCVVDPRSITPDQTRSLLLSPLGGANPSDLRALGRLLRNGERLASPDGLVNKSSDELIHDAVQNPASLVLIDDQCEGPARRLGTLLNAARQVMTSGGTAHEVLWTLWAQQPHRDDQLLTWGDRLEAAALNGGPQGRRADQSLDALVALFELAARDRERTDAKGVQNFLNKIQSQEIPADTLADRGIGAAAVRVLTAHRSKGLEWEMVVVADVQNDVWPDLRYRNSALKADLLGENEIFLPLPLSAVLEEELRLFFVAITRAKSRVVVTAVDTSDDDGGRPSRFLTFLEGKKDLALDLDSAQTSQGEQTKPSSRRLSLPALTAQLRATLISPQASTNDKAAAATILADLAQQKIGDIELAPAAHPQNWWGLNEPTAADVQPFPADREIALSGSRLEMLDNCPLRWFLAAAVKAEGPRSSEMGFGSVVHALAEEATLRDETPELDELMGHLDRVWNQLEFEAPWRAAQERIRAEGAIEAFLDWHNERQKTHTVAGVESRFSYVTQVGGRTLKLTGSIDRLEIDTESKVFVIDLKNQEDPPTDTKVKSNAQLGFYQMAVRDGALDEVLQTHIPDIAQEDHDVLLGGASLVQLRMGEGESAKVQPQPALPAREQGPVWIDQIVETAVAHISAGDFEPKPSEDCRFCHFKASCPTTNSGTGVIL